MILKGDEKKGDERGTEHFYTTSQRRTAADNGDGATFKRPQGSSPGPGPVTPFFHPLENWGLIGKTGGLNWGTGKPNFLPGLPWINWGTGKPNFLLAWLD